MGVKGSQIDVLWDGLRDNSGQPLAGGKVFTYTAGTSTPTNTWADVNKTTPLSNPIVLDANGRIQAYGDGNYKFIIKDASDNTLQTLDNLFYGFDDSSKMWSTVWGPTVGAPGGVSGTTIGYKFFKVEPQTLHFIINFTTTIIGTPTDVGFTVPLSTAYSGQAFSCYVNRVGSSVKAGAALISGATIYIYQHDYSAYAAGAQYTFGVSGSYVINI